MKKHIKTLHMQKNMRSGGMLYSSLPNTENSVMGMKKEVHESRPWSNSSPSGPLMPSRRACFPSIPSVRGGGDGRGQTECRRGGNGKTNVSRPVFNIAGAG